MLNHIQHNYYFHVVQYVDTGGEDINSYFSRRTGFSLSITPILPESRGDVKFVDGNLQLNPCYLSSEKDRKILKQALKFCINLLNQPPLKNQISDIENQDMILEKPDEYINQNFNSGAHLIGGLYKAINSDFKVLGLENLFVCDASILESFPSSNIHSGVVLLSSVFSEKFLSLSKRI